MVFQCINVCQVLGLGFQHLPQDLANVNEWKTMFDPYNGNALKFSIKHIEKPILSSDAVTSIFMSMSLNPVFTETGTYIYILH